MKMKRFLAATLAVGILGIMSGCNAMNDVKDDIKDGADRVEEGVDNVTGNEADDDVKIDVTLSVEAKDIIGSEYEADFDENMLADEGVILSQSKYTVEDGTTVQELVSKALDESKIEYNMDDNTAANNTMIGGIRGITNGMAGDPSGWVYSVNGNTVKDAMNTYKLKDGDDVKVYYKLDMGNDMDNNMNNVENNMEKTDGMENPTNDNASENTMN